VPLATIEPEGSGFAALARGWTLMLLHVSVQVLPFVEGPPLIVVVIDPAACAVTETVSPQTPNELFATLAPLVSKAKPLGAFKMIVPLPMSPAACSVSEGPVSVVQAVPGASEAVSAEMLVKPPDPAGLTIAAAAAGDAASNDVASNSATAVPTEIARRTLSLISCAFSTARLPRRDACGRW